MSPEAWQLSSLDPEISEPQDLSRNVAAEMLALGRRKAAALLEQARDEAEALRVQAVASGHQEGLALGRAEAREELVQRLAELETFRGDLMERFSQGVAELERGSNTRWEAYLDRVQAEVLDLAFGVCRRVLKKELFEDPTALAASVRRALQELDVRQPALVRLHPADWQHLEEMLQGAQPSGGFRLELDDRLGRGSFLVESEAGTVDGRLESRLEFLKAQLLNGD